MVVGFCWNYVIVVVIVGLFCEVIGNVKGCWWGGCVFIVNEVDWFCYRVVVWSWRIIVLWLVVDSVVIVFVYDDIGV